ncbi:MAG: 5'/3'-nucleotidase SurE, partial [Planctomycetia bacterium]
AIEGAFFGITSIAVSLEYDEHADFDRAAEIALDVIRELLSRSPPAGSLYNINFPTGALRGCPALRVVPMSTARYGEAFERRVDPRGRPYYWSTNEPPPPPSATESDVTALAAGDVTLTPLHFDLTRRVAIDALAEGAWRIGPRG